MHWKQYKVKTRTVTEFEIWTWQRSTLSEEAVKTDVQKTVHQMLKFGPGGMINKSEQTTEILSIDLLEEEK